MEALLQDIRYAVRQMRQSPSVALISILTLSLGVGAAVAIFSIVDAVVLRPLPYDHPELIVSPQTIAKQGYPQLTSYLSYEYMRKENHTLAALAGYWDGDRVNLESPLGPATLPSVQGSDNFFDIFGIHPMLGRTYVSGEDQPGRNAVAVLTYEVWRTNFGGQMNIIGKPIRLDGRPYTCIGVMPPGFDYPAGVYNSIYVPLHLNPAWKASRGYHTLKLIGRLKPGIAPEQSEADLSHLLATLGTSYPDTDGGRRLYMVNLADAVIGDTAGALWALSAAVLALLLIGCVNEAGLLLARGVKREREVALRAAIGAGRSRLVRQMLTESLVLALLGVVGGVTLSALLLVAMQAFLIHAIARGSEVHLNATVLAAAVVISSTTSIAACLMPALRLSSIAPNEVLKVGGRSGTARGQHRIRSIFIVTQIALSLLLLGVSGLLLRNLANYHNVNLGFDAKHILTAEIDLSPGRYQGQNVLQTFYGPLISRVLRLPSVEGAGTIDAPPIEAWGGNTDLHIAGQPPYPPHQQMMAEERFVSEGYFGAMGIRLLRGRMLSPALDNPKNKAFTVVVNQAFVRQFIPYNLDPVGQHLDDNDKADQKTEIVGVTTNIRQDLMQPPISEVDFLEDEIPVKDRAERLRSTTLIIRTSDDPRVIVPSLRDAFHALDPTLPFRAPQTMEDLISDRLVVQRMESWLFSIFAALALLLALVGIYGLISHEVALGVHENGVRMALGATRGVVLTLVLRRVAIMVLGGIAVGMALTFAARKIISFVVVVQFTHQAGMLVVLACALFCVGIAAALIPALRAATIEPIHALRSE